MWARAPGSAPGPPVRPAPHPLSRSAVGGPGRGGPIGAHVAIAGGGPEPLPRAGRKSASGSEHKGRVRGAQSRVAPVAAGGPLPAGGRRAEGSGIRGERGGGGAAGATPPPGAGRSGESCAAGGEALERILVARFSGWSCLGTGTPSAAAGFAEALARQVSTHTPFWFAANKARHRKRRSKCYSPCTGPRASRAEQPLSPRPNRPCAPQTPRTCLGAPKEVSDRETRGDWSWQRGRQYLLLLPPRPPSARSRPD